MRHYWDGGIVDNTPLTDAIDSFSVGPDVNRLLVVMNLFPQSSRLPTSYFEVTERVDELRFGNRVHQDVRAAERVNMLASTIDELARLVPGELSADLANNVAKARAMKLVNAVELTLEASPGSDQDNDYAFRDFSREGIEILKPWAGLWRFRRCAPNSTSFDVARGRGRKQCSPRREPHESLE